MDVLERLVAIDEIKQLKARYFRCIDTKDWQGFGEVFAPDAVMDMSGERVDAPADIEGDLVVRSADAIVALVRDSVADIQTMHHGHTPEIELLTPTTARGIWAMEDILGAGEVRRTVHGYGHYHETYEKVDGRWTIKTTRLTRLVKTVTMTRTTT